MSLKKGNELSEKGRYKEAIIEYQKIDKNSPLYKYAEFNIRHTQMMMNSGNNIRVSLNNYIQEPIVDSPLLSIVMPVFNVAPYLDTSIVSVLSQEYKNFELIIINDASTDNGLRIIEMHRQQDPRIKLINLDHNTLGGAAIPSNIGIKAAKGEYIAFVDSDDWVTPTAFAALMKQAILNTADLVIGSFCTFTEDERIVTPAYDGAAWEKVPKNKVISLKQCPALLRLSPVPWRKIYKREFLENNKIIYPEGDYFYEDNPLHWFVLSKAERIVVTNELVSYHRMAREGQTMSSATYKLSAVCCHLNTIYRFIEKLQGEQRDTLFTEFYDYCYRNDWIIKKQTDKAPQEIIKKRLAGIVKRASNTYPLKTNRVAYPKRLAEYEKAYPDLDLTIVMPVYNSADLVKDSLDSLLNIKGLKFNILAIDDGSTDDSLSVLNSYAEKHDNIHVFSQGNKGAGRARNSVIPLCTGTYTFFMDADDVVNSDNLVKAVNCAIKNKNDLLFFKYKIEFYEDKKSRGMFNADEKLWSQLANLKNNSEVKKVVSQLINYPWNRIIKTELLHDANIFFGSTVVHNDIPYHWHSVIAAENIGYINDEVCSHRKFSDRSQITNISDNRRMAVLEALRYTNQVLKKHADSKIVYNDWNKFSVDLLKWAEDRIPDELKETYQTKGRQLLVEMKNI